MKYTDCEFWIHPDFHVQEWYRFKEEVGDKKRKEIEAYFNQKYLVYDDGKEDYSV